jgi:hypothetical protein
MIFLENFILLAIGFLLGVYVGKWMSIEDKNK